MTAAKIEQRPTHFDRVDRVKRAVGKPVLAGDDNFWILGEPLVVLINGNERISVSTGFTTDGASVPVWAQRLTGWGRWEDPQRWGGILHDWMYTQRGTTKAHADNAFRDLLQSEGTCKWKREVMWAAVFVGGGPAYRKSQEKGPNIYV
ncbi:MAG: DUF1353 domain-containing protein [Acidimicrobiales bacterium]